MPLCDVGIEGPSIMILTGNCTNAYEIAKVLISIVYNGRKAMSVTLRTVHRSLYMNAYAEWKGSKFTTHVSYSGVLGFEFPLEKSTIFTEGLRDFFSSSLEVLGQCLKIDHDLFLPRR
jgi:hypothetical protein